MTVAVLSALSDELSLLVESLDRPKRDSIADWPVWSGYIGDETVVLSRAGLGKVNTAALTAILWERHLPSLVIFTGVAGGLDPTLGVGDVVIGQRTIQHDAGVIGASGLEPYQAGHIPFFNPTDELGYQPSDQILAAMRSVSSDVELSPVLDRVPQIRFGTILTGDQFLNDETARDRLFAEFSAEAVDMEGGALGQTAERLGVDHLVIRSLSDLAGEGAIEDFDRYVPVVAANSARLVLGLIDWLEEHDRDLTPGA